MTPAGLRDQLRRGDSPLLKRRRVVAALSLANIAAMGLMALYQVGVLEHVPEPPLPGFDSDKVNGSPEAYALFGAPDAVLGLGSYAVTLALAAIGPADRASTRPLLSLALAGKVAFDLAQSARLTAKEVVQIKALCFWCLLAGASSVASAALVVPEARAAWRTLTS